MNTRDLTAQWKEGGLYLTPQEDGTFTVLKILKTDTNGVHLKMYSNVFESIPVTLDETALFIAPPSDNQQALGAGHIPVSYASFETWRAVFIVQSKVSETELEGYHIWLDAQGGYFGSDLSQQKSHPKEQNDTTKIILWESKASPLLYINQYLFCLLLAFVLLYFDARLVIIPIILTAWLFLEAKAHRYQITEQHIYIESGLFDHQHEVIELKDIQGMMILQPAFFKAFSLGTLILVIDEYSEFHPCIKCIHKPERLMSKLKRMIES